jgi:ubiquinone/menaquinone biosynthesis C-methylase UbiE
MNGYFKQSDPCIEELAGYQLPSDWWSRGYEYSWAIKYAELGMTVADMGCGWMYRPFKDALAKVCEFVYAVDADQRLHEQKRAENMAFVIADITKEIFGIQDEQLDQVFCISVLEDLQDMVSPILKEFARVIKSDGLIVLTFDVPYQDAPTPIYPGLPLDKFETAMIDAGLSYDGEIDYSKEGAVNHQEWNLCCFHCVLKKKNNPRPA